MGKEQRLHAQLQHRESDGGASGIFCPMAFSRIGRQVNFRCAVVLMMSVAVFLSGIVWILPHHSRKYGFDAKEEIKLSATAQAFFKLPMPVSDLVPHIARLEYDITGEIGVPLTKVAILSMHQANASNWTDVVFGFLSDPIDVPIDPVSISVLKLSLIDLFLQQINLTLTTSIFGEPFSFEILRFPGGLTLNPDKSSPVWQIQQILFNFTLNNSIFEIKENYEELKEQLTLGLRLRPHENVYVQVTNINGSTREPPVTVEASVVSEQGALLPQRLKQLAQIITGSPAKNLGLDNSVFGKVKQVSLSSFLNNSINAPSPTPTPTPAPAPENDYFPAPSSSPYPLGIPSDPPNPSCHLTPAPASTHAPGPEPCNSPLSSPSPSIAPIISKGPTSLPPSPSITPYAHQIPPKLSPYASARAPQATPSPQMSPGSSPSPLRANGPSQGQAKDNAKGLVSPPSFAPSVSPLIASSSVGSARKICWPFLGHSIFHLLCWTLPCLLMILL